MKKLYFTKILNGRGCSTSSDFTVQEKEKLFSFFERFGMKRGTVYNRFFRDGFKPWELTGIESCITDFCILNDMEQPSEIKGFFNSCEPKESFVLYMAEKDMSRSTVFKKFPVWSFKDWQLLGVEALINRLLEEEGKEVSDA